MKTYKNELMAEVVGLSFGDGSLTIKKRDKALRYQLRGDAKEDRPHYLNYLIPLFNHNITQPLIGRDVSVIESKKSYRSFGFSIQNNEVGRFLSSLGIPIGKKDELPVPSWILNDKHYMARFLRGFFDTDGSIFCKKNYSQKEKIKHTKIWLKLATTSIVLSRHIQQMLKSLGIVCYVRSCKPTGKGRKTTYHIEVCFAKNVKKWFLIIGSKNPKHISKYQVWEKFGFCPPYTSLKERNSFLNGKLDPNTFYD